MGFFFTTKVNFFSNGCGFQTWEVGPPVTPSPVGSDAALFGIFNLGGNVREFTADSKVPFDDDQCWNNAGSKVNPTCLNVGIDRITRGGSWAWGEAESLTTYIRSTDRIDNSKKDYIGIRCVRSAQ